MNFVKHHFPRQYDTIKQHQPRHATEQLVKRTGFELLHAQGLLHSKGFRLTPTQRPTEHLHLLQTFCGFQAARSLNITTHRHLVLRLRMRGAIPPLPYTHSRRGAWAKGQLRLFNIINCTPTKLHSFSCTSTRTVSQFTLLTF